ncbi:MULTISPECIES: hypothetical protein [Roseiflexus]|jgi:hypothetical protein|uniref:hypothetical protein n=1 Tax=Roseiflexus TaxID=120961 RepID=UPI00059CFB5F|nr:MULTISPECIES: hypothetical protein [Roseiflexus]PMP77720.1 MAG: hypothetical protein C0183_17070 [Roseiflexus castenholzii]GIV98913.1 MAG: hypothetical protein KatS3mg058_0317 [Roseiflexus sp.]
MKLLRVIASSITRQLRRLSRFFRRSSPRRRSPELAELESQFYQDTNQDHERVWNRQVSNVIRSGRG